MFVCVFYINKKRKKEKRRTEGKEELEEEDTTLPKTIKVTQQKQKTKNCSKQSGLNKDRCWRRGGRRHIHRR